jgi:hypothetical protein
VVTTTPTGQDALLPQSGRPVHAPKNDFSAGVHVRFAGVGHVNGGTGS